MSEEWVDWVNEANEVIAAVPRSQMRREHLRHRASYIVILDEAERIYVQRRTQTKDYCPGMLDACCGGVVQAGEAYLPSAYRELEEEMGIRGVTLTEHGTHLLGDESCPVWGGLYSCHYQGPLQLQAEEVEYVLTMTPAQILARAEEFTPDSLQALQIWLRLTDVTGVPA
ncbi:NUDIX hydrolase YfcD [Pseudaeromonas paramecii]|uniref:NUDIX hydrolase YfcD n=1 Tax=Pseudaeromonas paramecii TaxID=2138166 RepID=A0ABP8Q644_9GAMM